MSLEFLSKQLEAGLSPIELNFYGMEFKYALSNSLFLFFSLSEDLSPRTMPQDYLA